MHDVVRVLDLPVLARDRGKARLEAPPGLDRRRRRILPGTLVAAARRAPVRHRALDRRTDLAQGVREIARGQRGLDRRHPAPDVHADRRRNDRANGRDDAADGGPDAPVDVRHRRHPAAHARQARHVVQLLRRRVFQADAADPRLDRHAALDLDRLVRPFRAHALLTLLHCPIPVATIVAENIALPAELRPRIIADGAAGIRTRDKCSSGRIRAEDWGDKSGETGVTAPCDGAAGIRTRPPYHVVPPAFTPTLLTAIPPRSRRSSDRTSIGPPRTPRPRRTPGRS